MNQENELHDAASGILLAVLLAIPAWLLAWAAWRGVTALWEGVE